MHACMLAPKLMTNVVLTDRCNDELLPMHMYIHIHTWFALSSAPSVTQTRNTMDTHHLLNSRCYVRIRIWFTVSYPFCFNEVLVVYLAPTMREIYGQVGQLISYFSLFEELDQPSSFIPIIHIDCFTIFILEAFERYETKQISFFFFLHVMDFVPNSRLKKFYKNKVHTCM